jgi:membrane-associated protease RseP (regulator of RpoE activity)
MRQHLHSPNQNLGTQSSEYHNGPIYDVPMPIFLITLFAAILLHLATIATVGHFMGVKVRVFSLGFGPTIFQLGTLRLGAIPTGGYVKFRDSVYEIVLPEETQTTLAGRSTFEQLAISLSGCAVLFVLGIAGDGVNGLEAFLNVPRQLLAGASSPFGDAQAFT